MNPTNRLSRLGAAAALILLPAAAHAESARSLQREFPRLDTTKSVIDLDELQSGGPPRDGIPAILNPRFMPVAGSTGLGEEEPVISLSGQCGAYAFPYRILIWHEIVNHDQCGQPVAVTYCPLCNTSMVFDRRIGQSVLSFGTTGRLRHSDLVMYDHQTETLWQQFTGEALVGRHVGTTLAAVPARIESFRRFREAFPDGQVLVPPSSGRGAYGRTPYANYDTAPAPFLFHGRLPGDIDAMARVVRVGTRAWSLAWLRKNAPVVTPDGLRIEWHDGQNSALDRSEIARGRMIGNVRVTKDGADVAYSVDFAFAYRAFYPDGELVK